MYDGEASNLKKIYDKIIMIYWSERRIKFYLQFCVDIWRLQRFNIYNYWFGEKIE